MHACTQAYYERVDRVSQSVSQSILLMMMMLMKKKKEEEEEENHVCLAGCDHHRHHHRCYSLQPVREGGRDFEIDDDGL